MKNIIIFIAFLLLAPPTLAEEKFLDIQEIKSKNGITAWLVEDHSLPIISLKFSFEHAGSKQNTADNQGVAQLLSNTLDEGAGDLDSQEFQKTLSDHSITLSFSSGRDNFGGQLKTLSRHQDKAFEMLKLALTDPRFDTEPLERMRQSNIARLRRAMSQPDWINARAFNDIAYQGHAYALNSGGTLSSLQNITVDDLKAHYKNWLAQDNLVIGVTGDITADALSAILDNIFDGLPAKSAENKITPLTLNNTGKKFLYNKDIPQTIITAAIPSLPMDHPDYDILRVMNYIYGGGGFGSKLMAEAREKRGLTYGIYSAPTHYDHTNLLTISTSTKNESVTEMLGIITAEMQNMRDTKLSAQELQDAKDYLIGSLPLSLTSTDKVAAILLSMQLNNRDINYLDRYAARINQVSAGDILRVANDVLDPVKILTIMVGSPANDGDYTKIENLNNVE